MSDTPGSPTSLAGLDRKQMEQERLARQASRKRGLAASGAPESSSAVDPKRVKLSNSSKALAPTEEVVVLDDESSDRNKYVKQSDQDLVVRSGIVKHGVSATPLFKPASPRSTRLDQPAPSVQTSISLAASHNLKYPNCTLKKTWAFGHPRDNDLKFEEVIQKDTLTTAVISSWQWDFDWLMTKFVPGKTKFVFVMEAKTEQDKSSWREQFAGISSVQLAFPPMSKSIYGRMHSKLMLLFHPTHLRVVVPTANPTKHDWGESGLLENTVFLIDLPRLTQPASAEITMETFTPFATELLAFLIAQGLPTEVLVGVKKFDFSKTANMSFVHSIPGTHNAEDTMWTTGLPALAQAVNSLQMSAPVNEKSEVHFATSSLGSLDDQQIEMFSQALRGDDPFESLSKQSKPALRGAVHGLGQIDFKIVFPSLRTVENSKGGTDAAGTIFLTSKIFANASFPRTLLHDYNSKRKGLLSHNKIILTRTTRTAHVYCGSANLSASAWGRLSIGKSGRGKAAEVVKKLTIANWECGVLLPGTIHKAAIDDITVLGKKLDLPFSIPARRYDDVEKPWMQTGTW